jgi:hypothetical protein
MKRFITFSVVALALIFTVMGIVMDRTSQASTDVSSGLFVLASRVNMAKSAFSEDKIVFSADDFKRYLNLSDISSITVTSVPPLSDGCLCVGNVAINPGQRISGENLDLLNYRVGEGGSEASSFKFTVNDYEYEMTCDMYFLKRENSSPTVALEDEKIFNVSTHQTITVYGKVGAYDPDGDKLHYEVVSYAKNGVLDFDSATGEYSYTPTGAYFGSDEFEYVAIDKYGNYSTSKKVSLTVQKLNTDVVYVDMEGNKAHNASITMAEKGIMSGSTIGSSTYFMPDKTVSRLDFLVMLMHSVGEDGSMSVFDTGFDDDAQIPQGLKGYVKRARDLGIISGAVNSDGEYLFEPNRAITRAEAALMVYSLVDGAAPTVKPTFSDKNDIPVWATDAIYTLNSLGILESVNGEIGANTDITRAQVAMMLYALINK